MEDGRELHKLWGSSNVWKAISFLKCSLFTYVHINLLLEGDNGAIMKEQINRDQISKRKTS